MSTDVSASWDDRVPVRPGDVIGEKYEIEEIIGSGGMGSVVAARHLMMRHRVAIKFLLPGLGERETTAARFAREAAVAAQLQNEHVVRVYDVGRLPDNVQFMVMEHLEGASLEDIVTRDGPMAVERAVDLFIQACDALACAHGYGIVHRDIKPANLFACPRPDGSELLKVLDFGVSKSTADFAVDMTSSSDFLGSPSYMPPEQFMSARDADARSDIWSLAGSLYRVLAGRKPYPSETIGQLCAAVMAGPPAGIRELRPDLPVALEAVIARAMAREPAERFPTASAFAEALLPFASMGSSDLVARISASEAAFAARAMTEETASDPDTLSLRSPQVSPTEPTMAAKDAAAPANDTEPVRTSTPLPEPPLESLRPHAVRLASRRRVTLRLVAAVCGAAAIGGGVSYLVLRPRPTTAVDGDTSPSDLRSDQPGVIIPTEAPVESHVGPAALPARPSNPARKAKRDPLDIELK